LWISLSVTVSELLSADVSSESSGESVVAIFAWDVLEQRRCRRLINEGSIAFEAPVELILLSGLGVE